MPLMLLNPAGVCLICGRAYNARRAGQVTTLVYSPAGQAHKLYFCRNCASEAADPQGRRFDRAVNAFLKKHPGWSAERHRNPEDLELQLNDLRPEKAMSFAKIIKGLWRKGELPHKDFEALARRLDQMGRERRELRYLRAAAWLLGQSFHPSAVKWGQPEYQADKTDRPRLTGEERYASVEGQWTAPATGELIDTLKFYDSDRRPIVGLELWYPSRMTAELLASKGIKMLKSESGDRAGNPEFIIRAGSPGRPSPYVWLRVGDAGEYERFDDLASAIAELLAREVGAVHGWMHNGLGFQTCAFRGHNYISIFKGGAQAEDLSVRLTPAERRQVEQGLSRAGNPGQPWHQQQARDYARKLAADQAAGHGGGEEFWSGALAAESKALAMGGRAGNPADQILETTHLTSDWTVQSLRGQQGVYYMVTSPEHVDYPLITPSGQVLFDWPERVPAGIKSLVKDWIVSEASKRTDLKLTDGRAGNPAENPAPLAGFKKFHNAAPDRSRRVQVPVGWPKKLWMLGRLRLLQLDTGEELRGGTVAAGSGNRIYLLNVTMPARLSRGARATQIEYVTPSCSERAGPVWFHPFDRPPQVVSCGRGFLTLAGKGLKLTRRGIVG